MEHHIINLKYNDMNYICILESTDSQNLNIQIGKEEMLNFKGSIDLKVIYKQVKMFDEFTIEEIFNALKEIKDDKYNIIKESENYKLYIIINILKKVKHLIINLNAVPKNDLKEKLKLTKNN